MRGQMLRIQRSSNGQVVFTLSGRMDEEHIAELETLIGSEANGRQIVLDLKDLTLAGQEAIEFLERCEADGVTLKNCAAYVREWITRQRRGS
jgi:anti-anti-sigma regulatory factor